MNLPIDLKNTEEAQLPEADMIELAERIRSWGQDLGFQQLGFSDIELGDHEVHLNNWL